LQAASAVQSERAAAQLPAQPASASASHRLIPPGPACAAARRSQLFGRLIRQPVSFFDSTETAQLTSRLAADCSVISRLFSTSINVALRNALQVLGGGAYLWRLSPQMTAVTAGVAAVLVLVAATYGSFTRRAQRVRGAVGLEEGARRSGRVNAGCGRQAAAGRGSR
jgi:ABC-type multidrug transport system fused ATPase/permease subunit